MILKSRFYKKQEPNRDAKLFIIFCEGSRREPKYFDYFTDIDSRIRLEIIKADPNDNNSPLGLYKNACTSLDKINLDIDDTVWFVIDTDQWGFAITELRKRCEEKHENWLVIVSNPCFEIWLYYHFKTKSAKTFEFQGCKEWKNHLNSIIKGGFDSRKHPILIDKAITNSEKNFEKENNEVLYGSTEVFRLAKEIYPLVKSELEKAKNRLKL